MHFLILQSILGVILCVYFPSIFINWVENGSLKIASVLASSCLFCVTLLNRYYFHKYPDIKLIRYTVPIVFFWSFLIFFVVKVIGVHIYLSFFILSTILILFFYFTIDVITLGEEQKMAYIPVGRAVDMPEQVSKVQWVKLTKPVFEHTVNCIVTDLHSNDLNDNWQHFIAEMALKRIPVYHHRNVRESLTGRVRITHMYENELGSLLPSANYLIFKRVLDSTLIILTLPVILPILLITSFLIKIESPGKILFTQKRVGQGGAEFIIYKFRSMCADSEGQGAQMATANDMRVTRVGKFIRKTRIDELPQFFNVLKGDMSLIGPRPEQKVFVEQFEKTIPFYNYRHIVKPGITGWAQVTQGYAGNEDETKIKVEHDFFYIKHFSFSLDLLIFFKTIHTMLTGFGAR